MDEQEITEQQYFHAFVMVSLERIYDLLLALVKLNGGSDEMVREILESHRKHDYMYPEPDGE